MILVAMQPHYLPYLGYLDLIDQADVFVLLDTVQFERQSWQNRNRIKTAQGVATLTVPVQRAFGQRIDATRVQDPVTWALKHFQTIRHAYRRAPYWECYGPELEAIYRRRWEFLRDLDECLIRFLAAAVGVKVSGPLAGSTKLVRASTLAATGKRTELLVNLCRELGADVYLSTPGAAAYLAHENPFPAAGIELRYNVYVHPVYRQLHGEFVPYLSALDLLLNEGSAAREILRAGRRPNSPVPPSTPGTPVPDTPDRGPGGGSRGDGNGGGLGLEVTRPRSAGPQSDARPIRSAKDGHREAGTGGDHDRPGGES